MRTAEDDGSERTLTADDSRALDAPDGEDADARLDSEEEEGHGEVSAGDDVLRGVSGFSGVACRRCRCRCRWDHDGGLRLSGERQGQGGRGLGGGEGD